MPLLSVDFGFAPVGTQVPSTFVLKGVQVDLPATSKIEPFGVRAGIQIPDKVDLGLPSPAAEAFVRVGCGANPPMVRFHLSDGSTVPSQPTKGPDKLAEAYHVGGTAKIVRIDLEFPNGEGVLLDLAAFVVAPKERGRTA